MSIDGIKLLEVSQAEAWQKERYITTGYRPPTVSFKACLASLFYLHNESVNIHSHLWAALFFLALLCANVIYPVSASRSSALVWLLPRPVLRFDLPSVSVEDTAVFAVFLLGAVICLGFSATFHCGACHSPSVCAALNRMDHLGIVILIVASFCPALFYGFYCHTFWQRLYISSMIGLGLSTRYRSPELKRERAYIFIALGLSGVLPVLHALIRDGWAQSSASFGLPWLLLEGVLYISGALLYADGYPERLHPRRFDIFGASHQIFHLLINSAALAHFPGLGIVQAFNHRHGRLGGSCAR